LPNKLGSFVAFPKKLSFFSAGFKKLVGSFPFNPTVSVLGKLDGSGTLKSKGSVIGLRAFSIFGSLLALGFEFAAVSNLESETSSSLTKVTAFCLVAYALVIE
jgi:hypothetical protein